MKLTGDPLLSYRVGFPSVRIGPIWRFVLYLRMTYCSGAPCRPAKAKDSKNAQSARFIEAAREAGASEDEAVFDENLKRVASLPKRTNGNRFADGWSDCWKSICGARKAIPPVPDITVPSGFGPHKLWIRTRLSGGRWQITC
jgi:hypothetical protein